MWRWKIKGCKVQGVHVRFVRASVDFWEHSVFILMKYSSSNFMQDPLTHEVFNFFFLKKSSNTGFAMGAPIDKLWFIYDLFYFLLAQKWPRTPVKIVTRFSKVANIPLLASARKIKTGYFWLFSFAVIDFATCPKMVIFASFQKFDFFEAMHKIRLRWL